ncbi:CG13397 [Drosophila busckii]|uniref:CG13397 n=1 Tax=Drosophila busckii TaxID=30019 RepID=A0A0M3QTH2_DROBS|nr:alpha-N-acetylglucosaminidase [Drosophila busckii]ALC38879.1 CG13397 [Drosophila busckii]
MHGLRLLLILLLIQQGRSKDFGAELLSRIVPETKPIEQELAVRELIERVLGERAANLFEVQVDKSLELRSYQIELLTTRKVRIAGWDGVSVCKGLHYYLKYALHKDVDWFKTQIELPDNLQLPNITYRSTSASAIVYYQNVCTWSYSFAWWNFAQWRRHIDWMALMGINLSLAPNQEHIWQQLYQELGLSAEEIAAHFAGPAFQAWQRMGNIRGWAGPLPPTYTRLQQLLQQQVLQAQRALGMSVALPAFAGHVPVAMRRIYPNASLTAMERWNHFPSSYCCSLFVEPSDPLFKQLATLFLQRVQQTYGSNHIYFSDPFNEMRPRLAEPAYVEATAKAIYESMHAVDAQAVWLLQGWMFLRTSFWSDALVQAFLTAVPLGNILALDLQSEQFPQYQRTYSYYGQPFVWCMLHNFGGTLGMFGSVEIINKGITAARRLPHGSMVGVGITPEGIGQNYVLYALTLERAWSDAELQLVDWFNYYAWTRYGVNDTRLAQAWQLLRGSVYSYYGLERMRGKYAINRRPSLGQTPWTWYNSSSIEQAWQLLLSANAIIPLEDDKYAMYAHDLVDITRQFLQQSADQLYVNLKSAYRKKQLQRFEYLGSKLLLLLDDLELILASSSHFLLGSWLQSSKQLAPTSQLRANFEFNARNQITAWGPDGQILDYASKQWSGLVADYYKPRWQLFLDAVTLALQSQRSFNATDYKLRVAKEIELPFSYETKEYPTHSIGDSWYISQQIYARWLDFSKDTQFLHYNCLPVNIRYTEF